VEERRRDRDFSAMTVQTVFDQVTAVTGSQAREVPEVW